MAHVHTKFKQIFKFESERGLHSVRIWACIGENRRPQSLHGNSFRIIFICTAKKPKWKPTEPTEIDSLVLFFFANWKTHGQRKVRGLLMNNLYSVWRYLCKRRICEKLIVNQKSVVFIEVCGSISQWHRFWHVGWRKI